MKILLLTNILCWMSHVSYSLYFTDYVGEAIFNGDPKVGLMLFQNFICIKDGW